LTRRAAGACPAPAGEPITQPTNQHSTPAVLDSSVPHQVDAAAGDPYLAQDVLEPVRERLAVARAVRPADAGTRAAALERLRVPEPPSGLSAEQAARFARLGQLAAALRDVYVVDTDLGPLPLAVAADTADTAHTINKPTPDTRPTSKRHWYSGPVVM
jgi:hypothetical protein